MLADARQFVFGFAPKNADCKFSAGTDIKLVANTENVLGMNKKR